VAEARRRANGGSLSSYVNEALRRQVLADRRLKFLDEWEREFGPIPEELIAEAERTLAEADAEWPD
jgi:hypothetical protein